MEHSCLGALVISRVLSVSPGGLALPKLSKWCVGCSSVSAPSVTGGLSMTLAWRFVLGGLSLQSWKGRRQAEH